MSILPAAVRFSVTRRLPASVLVWVALIGYLILVKFVFLLFPTDLRGRDSLFSWPNIIAFAALGLVGVVLARRTGFPEALDERVTNRQRFVIPILLGIAIAIIAVALDVLSGASKFINAQIGQSSYNVGFPASLLVYSAGIVDIETQYRLFLLPVLLWLISNVILRHHAQERVFWILAVVLSLLEPLQQGVVVGVIAQGHDMARLLLTLFVPYFVTAYPLNLGQAYMFRRYGFLASMAMRLGYYMIWHVVYGNFLFPAFYG